MTETSIPSPQGTARQPSQEPGRPIVGGRRQLGDAGGELLWDMLDQSADIVVCYDTALRRTYANAAYERQTGRPSTQYLGRAIDEDSGVGVDAGEMIVCLRRALATGQAQRLDFEWRSADGDLTWHALRVSLIRDKAGSTVGLVSMARDITVRKQAERQLAERERQFRALVENSPDYIVRYSTEGERLYVNPALRALVPDPRMRLGLAPEPGASPIVDAARYKQLILEVATTGESRQAELQARLPDGTERWVDVRFCAEIDDAGTVVSVLTVGRDVTDAVAMRHKFEAQALSDPLTGLGNRQAVYSRGRTLIAEAKRHERQVGAMVLDLDRFKEVNDTLGHQAGDELLKQLAARLAHITRGYDLLARLGGDEFVILVPSLARGEDMAALAAKVIQALAGPVMLGGCAVHAGASIGIAVYPGDGEELDTLLAHADLAMYQAKRSGRGQFVFYRGEFSVQVRHRVELEGALRAARDGEGFELFYQPQIGLADGTLVGAEALLRWHPPTLGMVPPDVFIPVAEDSGLIVPIGRWVLRQACAAAARWNRGREASFRVAVNISVQQFVRDDLVAAVREALASTGCEARWLSLEVTESLLLENSARVMATLRELTHMGLLIEIDDFGTGYSSLGYLARFDVHCLKIDRSFTRDITTEPRQRELVKAFIAIAKALGMSVVAEGVESQAEADFLLAHGCPKAQGFLFSRPLSAEVFETEWVDAVSAAHAP